VLEALKLPAKTPSGVVNGVAGPPHISIDPNGNLTQKVEGTTAWTYEWNAESQLTRVLSNGSEVARYKYDPIGRRAEKVAGGATKAWAYEGLQILREVSGTGTNQFVYGPAIDEPLLRVDGAGVTTSFHSDVFGSVVATSDGSGAVTSSHGYEAFGDSDTPAPWFGFTGREWDPEVGLYYYRARYYDPKIARFVSEDPIRFLGGINLYAYVGNRPTGFVDPFGTQADSANKSAQKMGKAARWWMNATKAIDCVGLAAYYVECTCKAIACAQEMDAVTPDLAVQMSDQNTGYNGTAKVRACWRDEPSCKKMEEYQAACFSDLLTPIPSVPTLPDPPPSPAPMPPSPGPSAPSGRE
jgi:RHS repeat-associated protein